MISHFSRLDWAIVLIYISATCSLAIYMKSRVKSMLDFVCAGRHIGLFLGIASMAGTEMGLITIMYSAEKGFQGGFAAFHIALVAGIITLIVGLTGFIVEPLRQHQVLTIPEYYEKRFGKSTRILGGLLLALGGILNMGLFLKVGALFIIHITGIGTHLTPIVMSILLVIVLLYTCFGGMVSVILTDYLQFVLLSMGLLLSIFLSITTLGWDTIINTVTEQLGESGFNPFSQSGEFGWSYVIWMAITAGLVSCAIWPTAVARTLALKKVSDVKKQYLWSSISFMIRFLLPNFLGICAFVYFSNLGESSTALSGLPQYLGQLLPTGLLGLVVAAMIAAFMSTHDSYLLCWSSVITQDIIAPLLPLNDQQKIKLTRFIIIIIGLYIWYWGLFYEGSDAIWDYLAITGAIYFTGAIAILVGGLYWKKANQRGAQAALIVGCSALLGLSPIKHAVGLGHWSGANIGLLTVILTCVAMGIGSILFPDQKELKS